MMKWLVLVVLMAGCEDKRCSVENCTIVREKCNLEPAGSPSFGTCSDKVTPTTYDAAKYCVRACNGTGSGRVMQCVADAAAKGLCADPDALDAQCQLAGIPSGKVPNAACVQQCADTRKTCGEACPATSFDACLDCDQTCALTESDCYSKC